MSAAEHGRVARHSRWSPMGLPDQRRDLVEALRASSRREHDETITRRMRDLALQLAAAEMYWVSQPMTHVALDASTDVPDWTPAAVLPAPVGVLVWEDPLPPYPGSGLPRQAWVPGGLGVPQPPDLPLAGVVWAQYGGHVRVVGLSRRDDILAVTPDGVRLDVGAALWPTCEVTPIPADEVAEAGTMTGVAGSLLAMLATTWVLMQQPTMATPRRVLPKGRAYRAAARLGRAEAEGVSVIDLRRLDVAPPEHAEDAGPSGRVYRHRWVVRGHWRQQAHGPGRSQRRPVWIPSYVKGPNDAPLLVTEHVHVWRR